MQCELGILAFTITENGMWSEHRLQMNGIHIQNSGIRKFGIHIHIHIHIHNYSHSQVWHSVLAVTTEHLTGQVYPISNRLQNSDS